jgi:hypothetical protein
LAWQRRLPHRGSLTAQEAFNPTLQIAQPFSHKVIAQPIALSRDSENPVPCYRNLALVSARTPRLPPSCYKQQRNGLSRKKIDTAVRSSVNHPSTSNMYRRASAQQRLPRLGLLLFCLVLISSHQALFILASVTNQAPPHAVNNGNTGRAPLSTAGW